MSEGALVSLKIDGREVRVRAGTTVAAAVMNEGTITLRRSVGGERRSVLCGMGVCFECRVRVDGIEGVRACMVACREGMRVQTGGGRA